MSNVVGVEDNDITFVKPVHASGILKHLPFPLIFDTHKTYISQWSHFRNEEVEAQVHNFQEGTLEFGI